MIVCKFGGTSLSCADNYKRVADILTSNSDRRFAVASASGKRYDNDKKITDLLYECYRQPYDKAVITFQKVVDRYLDTVNRLKIDVDIENISAPYTKWLRIKSNVAELVAMGEHLSAVILAKLLGWRFVDGRQIIKFDENRNCDYKRSYACCRELTDYSVIAGFYGQNALGETVLFERGGSDITGSIVARGVNADLYENWSDVSGVCLVDPRLVDSPRIIDKLTYDQLKTLSFGGARVIQSDSVDPVRQSKIPLVIKNTFSPFDKGTVVSDTPSSEYEISGIAFKRGYDVVTIARNDIIGKIDEIERVTSVFRDLKIKSELIDLSVDTLSFAYLSTENYYEKITAELKEINSDYSVTLKSDNALVRVVENDCGRSALILARILSAIAKEKIEILFMRKSFDNLETTFVVDQKDCNRLSETIYKEFII